LSWQVLKEEEIHWRFALIQKLLDPGQWPGLSCHCEIFSVFRLNLIII